jgi:hypothetical protein
MSLDHLIGKREQVVRSLANGVQDAAALDREGLGELLGEAVALPSLLLIRFRARHGARPR